LANRNFDPETRTLRKRQANEEIEDTLEKNVKGLAEQIIAEDEAKRAQDLVAVIFTQFSTPLNVHVQDLLNIAPKRPNWDLKRELEKKVAKLERQTQQAIHTLIRTYDVCLLPSAPIDMPARATTCCTKGSGRRPRRCHAGRSKC
jgi:coiled-coil domain-containing protein 12